ncbi:hypothetical protein FF38_04620 [Lucilia cuprina]|uniref:Lipase domain-containing protein n=1 Tax=Lucilia cuprina TaxID=7375 RepID=A0A0L0BWC7_LUCCU|nr:hypothetical protein FF38_04620 [Lucilia cuprina]
MANETTKYLTTNQKHLNAKQQQQEPKDQQLEQNSNQLQHHYPTTATTLEFNNTNNENNHDYFNLNNKLKTITEDEMAKEIDAKETKQSGKYNDNNGKHAEQKQKEEEEEVKQKFKENLQTKYYVPLNSFSNDWLGHLPQFQLQPRQLQLFLQQPQLQQEQSTSASSSSTAAAATQSTLAAAVASLLPQEYHLLSDYSFLFNAERHTGFYLHTLTQQQDYMAVATKQASSQPPPPAAATAAASAATLASFKQDVAQDLYNDEDYYDADDDVDNNDDEDYYYNFYDPDEDADANDDENVNASETDAMETMVNLTNPRVLNVVTDTIGAVFGVNTRPVAGIQGIHIEEIQLYNGLSLRQSRFNPFNPCRILIHGWLGGSHAGIYNTLVPEYFKLQEGNYNIITVDWGKGAIADYITASYRVKPVGIVVAKFIDFLHQESGIPFANIHVIGFSMGAHIAGISGKFVQTGRLPVIYGLDPALPLFRYENVNERLDLRDAEYVEVLHTSVGSYGYDHPLGHVDFYINYGYNQPGCFFNECSHFRAFQVFAQTLRNELLMGSECLGEMWWDMIKHKRCLREMGRSLKIGVEGMTANEMVLRRGLYYVITNAQPPYKVG